MWKWAYALSVVFFLNCTQVFVRHKFMAAFIAAIAVELLSVDTVNQTSVLYQLRGKKCCANQVGHADWTFLDVPN